MALAVAAPAFAEGHYFSVAEDLPLAPGLAEDAAAFSFDGAGGRIVGGSARGPTTPAALRRFYEVALPPLGWSQSPGEGGADAMVFLRDREQLTLSIAVEGRLTVLGVRLSFQPAPRD
jgi:hypothetical protein